MTPSGRRVTSYERVRNLEASHPLATEALLSTRGATLLGVVNIHTKTRQMVDAVLDGQDPEDIARERSVQPIWVIQAFSRVLGETEARIRRERGLEP